MTLTEAVLFVVKEMEEEAEGSDKEEFEQVSAALHRYARKLKNAVNRDKLHDVLSSLPDSVSSAVVEFPDGDTK
jgi:uncharacterized protein (DUF2267 family)